MATGVGGPLGGMLIGAGVDTVIQRATTGRVDYGQVAVSGLLGAAGGGAATALLKGGGRVATALGGTPLRAAITTGAASGAAAGAGSGGYTYMTGPGPHTVSGFVQAVGGGALSGTVMGGAGGAAGHGLQTLGRNVLGHLWPQPSGEGIIYYRTDLTGRLKPYVGQTQNPETYLRRQAAHRRNNPNSRFDFDELEESLPADQLDRYEEYYIRLNGGPTNNSNPNGGLSNARHQMSDQRYDAAGGDPY